MTQDRFTRDQDRVRHEEMEFVKWVINLRETEHSWVLLDEAIILAGRALRSAEQTLGFNKEDSWKGWKAKEEVRRLQSMCRYLKLRRESVKKTDGPEETPRKKNP